MNDNVFMTFYIGENDGGKSTLLNAISRSNPNGTLTIGLNVYETISKTAFSVLESLTSQQSETLKSILSDMFIWFEDFILTDRKVMVKTSHETIELHKCATGFYCVQYYLALILSTMTPQTISIDNVDSGLNPKLCRVLIKTLAALAKKSNKKLFLTGHNPASLDGIDLGDAGQQLIVISKDHNGQIYGNRITIEDKPKSSIRSRLDRMLNDNEVLTKQQLLDKFDASEEPIKLSEAFIRGYLGGLPEYLDLNITV